MDKTGRQEPTFRNCAPYKATYGDKCADFLSCADVALMDWQRGLIDDWLSYNTPGTWANKTCVAVVSRQNGKTDVVLDRAAFGMVSAAEWIIYTSHLQKTSTESFEALAALFDTPKLRKYVKTIKTALGREEIILTNGGKCKFLARTRNGGRGQHGDLLILDEFQELTDEQQGSFLPAFSASKNAQYIYLGTPPDENASGEVFYRLRDDAKNGNDRVCFAEWAVEEMGDTADENRWYLTNPSLGILLDIEQIRSEHAQLAPDRFARERLGWVSKSLEVDNVVPEYLWDKCEIERAPEDGIDSYGVKFSADGSTVAVSVCRKNKEENTHFIELLFCESTARGTGWLVDWIIERKMKFACVAVDGTAGAQAFLDRLSDALSVRQIARPRVSDVIAANVSLMNYANEGLLSHSGQPQLKDSATLTAKRRIGHDGGWGWQTNDKADAAPIESAALAIWAADKTKRDPNRKTGVAF